MAKTQYLEYTIYLTDKDQVAALQAVGSPAFMGAIVEAPTVAATTYSAPIQEEGTPQTAPCIRSSWFTATGNNFPRDQRTFERCNGGWFGICFLFGTRIRFYWRGRFEYAPPVAPVESPVPGEPTKQPIAERYWIDGFELPTNGEGGTTTINQHSRGGSRHLQGFGASVRNVATTKTHSLTENGAAADKKIWERFYVRVRRYPTAAQRVWRSAGATSAAAGIILDMMPDGKLRVQNSDNIGTLYDHVTLSIPFALHVWHRLDLLIEYGATARFQLYVDGAQQVDRATASFTGQGGLAQVQNYQSGTIGGGVAAGLGIDFDDWIGAKQPSAGTNPELKPGLDWNNGSRVAYLGATGLGTSPGTWVGDWRLLRQRPVGVTAPAPIVLTSSTSGDRLVVTTDADLEADAVANAIGYVALNIGLFSQKGAGADGTLGYKLPAGAEVLASIAQNAGAQQWNNVLYHPTGLLDPIRPLAGLQLIHVKGATGTASTVQALAASAELIGVFGQEDVTTQAAEPVASPPTPAVAGVDVVTNQKANCVARGISLVGDDGAFQINKRVAWALRESGIGLLEKLTGANSGGYATDVLVYKTGVWVDVLINAGTSNTPAWQIHAADPALALRWKEPIDPGDAGELSTINEKVGLHNAPYPRSPWARHGQPPFSPVGFDLRTYVGNGTFQDFIFRFPVHMLWIRPLTAGSGPIIWWSSMNTAHAGGELRYAPDAVLQVQIDPTFVGGAAEDAQEQRTLVRVAGTNVAMNSNLANYQLLAICDPGMRFSNAGALSEHGVALDAVTNLDNERFTPECLFAQQEQSGNTATVSLFYKGPGHAAASISSLGAAETASALAMQQGSLTSSSAFHNGSFSQIAFFALRRDDGSGDAGVVRVLQLASFTGDGSASRTVGLSPLSARRPGFAIVVPHNGAAVYRDPSHTGTTSTTFPNTANAATGITGGAIDSISLGSALNSNGVVYDVFVIPGGTTAGNGGWSQNGEFIPVAPDSPKFGEGPWDGEPDDPEAPVVPPTDPTTTPPFPSPIDPTGTATDFATGCVAATQQIANLALQRIGVSKQITALVTEMTQEAIAVRLTYTEDLSKTLREFPWPFATRYATLTLVAGTSSVRVNGDWQYAYRAPANMLFARRIVNLSGTKRGFDPNPIAFRVGADDTGQLIYTDALTPELEYTIRPTCAASSGDALFRDALCWRLAASLAPTLSRDAKRQAFCLTMYEQAKAIARVPGANEGQQDKSGDADWITGRN